MSAQQEFRKYHAAVWDEPIIMEMGRPGRRGVSLPEPEEAVTSLVGDPRELVAPGMRRKEKARLPELSEYEVLRHYLHLSQQTLGMIGINLLGTCTMKYNPRVSERVTSVPEIERVHPYQDEDTLQGILEIIYRCDEMLQALSGMDRFSFQPGGGAHAAYLHACLTRAYHAANGELNSRDQVIVSIKSHPCNAATAAAAGFEVITLMLDEEGYPSVEALEAAVSERTAALMVSNPDDMGVYNPNIKQFNAVVHEAGGLSFCDNANFNGVMGMVRPRDVGFDACMYMLHKTFGAPKTGGGPAAGAYGCTAELARFLPAPVVERDGERYGLDFDRPDAIGGVREYWGNVPLVVKTYAWIRAMGAEGIHEARDLSVLASNYMRQRLLGMRGIAGSIPENTKRRLEAAEYSLEQVQQDTGVTVFDVQNRMMDFGVDRVELSHEPWQVPQPITIQVGETWSKEDIDYWLAVLEEIIREAYEDPEIVKSAPHNQSIHQLDASQANDPALWAMTWRAHVKKRGAARAGEPATVAAS